VAGFCRDRGLRAAQFFWWKKRLAEGRKDGGFIELRPEVAEAGYQLGAVPIEVRLGNGRSLVVPAGFDRDHLARLLETLEPRS
jgi:hypothetical protein